MILSGILLFSGSIIFAHPGRTDKYGGHKGPNGYHYHNGGSSSSSSSSSPKTDYETLSSNDILRVQVLLKELGFYSGTANGIADASTLIAANKARIFYKTSESEYKSIPKHLLTRLESESTY
ncbi:hypothetical protein ACYULU_07970 [Breznakiellaceae bacterium SP9]